MWFDLPGESIPKKDSGILSPGRSKHTNNNNNTNNTNKNNNNNDDNNNNNNNNNNNKEGNPFSRMDCYQ